MIFTERTIRVTNGVSQINSPIVLYKGDKNIKIRFKIVDCPYTYSKNVDNIIEVSEASYAQLVIKTPNNGVPIFSDIAETESGYVTFTITGEMIDGAEEVGKYSFQVRLLDSEQFSRITIPEVVNGIDVREPIAIENISPTNEVDIATVGYALTTAAAPEDAFNSEGNYNKTTWGTGDRITAAKLNKIEAGIDGVNKKVASGGTGSNNAGDISITDTGNYFTSTNVEGALQEAGSQINDITNLIGDKETTLSTTAQNLKDAINELFQYVSNGKTLIASAITDKGVVTSNTDTFETMANKILQISGSGTEIIGNDDIIQLSDIVSYYQEPTQNIANEINALGGEYVSFIVATDTHGTTNANNSQNIIRYLLKNTKARRFFHLGDVVGNDWDESHYHLYFNPFEKCIPQVFYTSGNHEWQNGTANDHVVMYRELLSNKSYLQGNPEGFYYYFDDTDKKIRYLVINTSDGAYNAVTSSQLTWIRNSVQLPTPEWNLIAFGHLDIMPNDPITGSYQSNAASSITNALSSTNGTIIGYFCGHEHIDRISKVNDTFYQTILLNDSCEQETSFADITTPTRTLGTVSEQAISIVSINLNTHVVTIRRIGAGEKLTYTYTKGTSSSGATYTITRNLTNCTSSSSVATVVKNTSHTETFTANTGYTLNGATVTITMGGTDISSSYSNGTLNIASVTGDIIITISAIEKQTSETDNWIDGVPYNLNLINDEYVKITGEIEAYSGWSRTDYLKCNGAAKLGFLHCTNSDYNCFYDENKKFISKFSMTYNVDSEKFVTVPSNAVYFICSASTDSMDGSNSTYGGAIQITPYANA